MASPATRRVDNPEHGLKYHKGGKGSLRGAGRLAGSTGRKEEAKRAWDTASIRHLPGRGRDGASSHGSLHLTAVVRQRIKAHHRKTHDGPPGLKAGRHGKEGRLGGDGP